MTRVEEIEQNPQIKIAAHVLKLLEKKGLEQPAIASGYIRGFLTNTTPTDIDIAYVGKVHYQDAQKYLFEIITQLKLDPGPWDLKGIWNAQIECPEIDTTEKNYLTFYVDSIDSVYLASDAKLHDPTGHGFKDAESKTLRMTDFKSNGFKYSKSKIVYLCLEGCRRIANFNWKPTPKSISLIKSGIELWPQLSQQSKNYFYNRTSKKYSLDQFSNAQKIYKKYGWDFIFSETKVYLEKINHSIII